MKRILICILALTMLGTTCSCSNNVPNKSDDSPKTSTTKQVDKDDDSNEDSEQNNTKDDNQLNKSETDSDTKQKMNVAVTSTESSCIEITSAKVETATEETATGNLSGLKFTFGCTTDSKLFSGDSVYHSISFLDENKNKYTDALMSYYDNSEFYILVPSSVPSGNYTICVSLFDDTDNNYDSYINITFNK